MIALELKTYTPTAAGVGRYSMQLVSNLLKRNNSDYFGYLSPKTQKLDLNLLADHCYVNQQSTILRSLLIPWFHWNSKISILHTLDASTFYGLDYKKVKRVTTVHDLISLKFPQYFTRKMRLILKGRFYHAVKNSDHLIADSISTKRDLLEYFPKLQEEKITVIPLASSINKANCHDSIQSDALKELIKNNHRYFLSVATHEPRKNIKLVIEAFQALRQKYDRTIKLVLVGKPGWLFESAIHSKAELLENVICTGAISDQELKAWYKDALALVYPSLYEGFGLPVLEGMAMGCPVITSNTSSLPEVAGDAAKLVDPYSLFDLTNAMSELLESELLRDQYRTKGLSQSAKFSWSQSAELTEQVYRSLT